MTPNWAPHCGCTEHEVIAYADEDGDWTCSKCGRLLGRASIDS
jgi:transcription initiation factor TFIIIB Brf1 subunit/transcription initiation factor TFIIB